jgi:hypothetical protein
MENINRKTFVQVIKSLIVAMVAVSFMPLSIFGAPAILDTAINPDNGHVYLPA